MVFRTNGEHVPTGISGDYDIRSKETSAANEAVAATSYRASRTEELIALLDDPKASPEARDRAINEINRLFNDAGIGGIG